jgi:hypothetical protein
VALKDPEEELPLSRSTSQAMSPPATATTITAPNRNLRV